MPGLVTKPRAGPPDRRDDDHGQRDGAGHREEHPRVVDDEVDEGAPDPELGRGCIPERRQDDVRQQEVERREPGEPVRPHDGVLPETALQERDSRHEDDLDEEQHGRQQSGQPAERVERAADRAELLRPLTRDPEADDEHDREAAQRGRQLTPPVGVVGRAASRGPCGAVDHSRRELLCRRFRGHHGGARQHILGRLSVRPLWPGHVRATRRAAGGRSAR